VRMRHSITTWSERAFSRRSHRHSVAIDVVLVARRNRQRRALQRWHMNVSESVLEKLQNNAATRHWLFFVFKLFRGEIARRQESRIQTLNKLGFAALRRLVTCYCGWRSLVRETRAIKRRVKRCRDTTRAGHFLETGGHTRRNVFLHKESIDNKKLAERARTIRETRDLEDTACLGPIVCVAARARTRQQRARARTRKPRWTLTSSSRRWHTRAPRAWGLPAHGAVLPPPQHPAHGAVLAPPQHSAHGAVLPPQRSAHSAMSPPALRSRR
jgi:hypothetical protein